MQKIMNKILMKFSSWNFSDNDKPILLQKSNSLEGRGRKKNTFISTWAFSLTKVTEFIRIYSKLLNKDRNLIVGFILLFVSTRTDPFHKLFLRYLTSILISDFCKFPCRLWGLYFFIVTLSINSSSIKCLSI